MLREILSEGLSQLEQAKQLRRGYAPQLDLLSGKYDSDSPTV